MSQWELAAFLFAKFKTVWIATIISSASTAPLDFFRALMEQAVFNVQYLIVWAASLIMSVPFAKQGWFYRMLQEHLFVWLAISLTVWLVQQTIPVTSALKDLQIITMRVVLYAYLHVQLAIVKAPALLVYLHIT